MALAPVLQAQPLEYPTLGLAFEVLDGWVGQETDGGYMMGHQTIPGMILLTPHQASSLDELRAEAQAGLHDEQGTQLQLVDAVQDFGKRGVRADMQGWVEGTPAKAHVIGLMSPHGGGLTIMALVAEAEFSAAYRSYAETVAQSVVFSKPEIPPVVDEWTATLLNYRLTYLDSYSSNTAGGGGYSQEETIDLCNGYFLYNNTDVNAFGQYAGMNSQQRGNGAWEVISNGADGAVLVLRFRDGSEKSYDLGWEDGKTYLNGYRYFRTGMNDIADHRPNCQ